MVWASLEISGEEPGLVALETGLKELVVVENGLAETLLKEDLSGMVGLLVGLDWSRELFLDCSEIPRVEP